MSKRHENKPRQTLTDSLYFLEGKATSNPFAISQKSQEIKINISQGAFEATASNESCLSGPSSDPSKCGERGLGPRRGRPACRTHCPLRLSISRTRRAGRPGPAAK